MSPVLGTLVFTILVPGTFVFVVPILLGSNSGNPLPAKGIFVIFGLGLVLLGSVIYIWAARVFVRKGKGTPAPIAPPIEFVAVGPYRYVRNPIYVGELMTVIGIALLFESLLVLIYASALFTVFHLFIVAYEEPNLSRRFGTSYAQYLKVVDRWLPVRSLLRRESA